MCFLKIKGCYFPNNSEGGILSDFTRFANAVFEIEQVQHKHAMFLLIDVEIFPFVELCHRNWHDCDKIVGTSHLMYF